MQNDDTKNETMQRDPRQILAEAQQRHDAIVREAGELGQKRREVLQEDTLGRIRAALRGGDVAGAAAAARVDLEAVELRERDLPSEHWASQVALAQAEADVHRREQEELDAQEPELRAALVEAREALEAAETAFSNAQGSYQWNRSRSERIEEQRYRAEDRAEGLLERGPSLAPLGGTPSVLGEAVDRRQAARNLTRPNRTGIHQRSE